MKNESISIRGARQHNLKNIDLQVPRNRFVVISGVSGSGKSSLAFDTLFAEGQRRYLEALSTYARQMAGRLNAPLVDEIEGLSPSIAIEQKGLPHNPRSTVGTLTEIYDYLRLLFARLGTIFCPNCDLPVRAWTLPDILRDLSETLPPKSRILVLAPLGKVGEKDLPDLLKRLRRDGFGRVRAEGSVYELDPPPSLPRRPAHRIEIVVDRLVLDEEKQRRLVDSLELALRVGKGTAGIATPEGEEKFYSESARCASCGYTAPELTPSLFSFQHPSGMCPVCRGLGYTGADEDQAAGGERIPAAADTEGTELPGFSSEPAPCPACMGTRLNEAARSVRLGALSIDQVSPNEPLRIAEWLERLDFDQVPAARFLDRAQKRILNRLNNLIELGLPYLTLDRRLQYAFGRRGPARPPRSPDQLDAFRRTLCSG